MRQIISGILVLLFLSGAQSFAQTKPDSLTHDQKMIREIYNVALTQGMAYKRLEYLCKEIGPRLSGSENAAKSVEYTYEQFQQMGIDKAWKQECMVPHWVRGKDETAWFKSKNGKEKVPVCALGMSVGTGKKGIKAEVVEVTSIEQVKEMDRADLEGKIVFYNRPMDAKFLNTFAAYGSCVDQRSVGAIEAGRKGALAVVVRSMNLRLDDFPHTGSMRYEEGVTKIPACAISTNGAEELHAALESDPNLEFFLQMNCETLEDAPSHNVIGEIRGTEFPDEIIIVGGHLDSWDLGEGAHDDGAGVMQSMEVLQIFKKMGYKPKRTIRAVMFMNEENGMKGAIKYGEEAAAKGEVHIAALESDRGGFTPRGFSIERDDALAYIENWSDELSPYFLKDIAKGYGGVDISPLRKQGTPLIGFSPDSQRYFDHHHCANDVFEEVNKRELELGAASMAALVYLISEYGMDGLEKVKPE